MVTIRWLSESTRIISSGQIRQLEGLALFCRWHVGGSIMRRSSAPIWQMPALLLYWLAAQLPCAGGKVVLTIGTQVNLRWKVIPWKMENKFSLVDCAVKSHKDRQLLVGTTCWCS
jgi:hypothetical protein